MRELLHVLSTGFATMEVGERGGSTLALRQNLHHYEAIRFRSEPFRPPKRALPDRLYLPRLRPYRLYLEQLADDKSSRNVHPPP
jgi:hypothetical protein